LGVTRSAQAMAVFLRINSDRFFSGKARSLFLFLSGLKASEKSIAA
jgi:hypothetical protein